jgi:hypothetical protein
MRRARADSAGIRIFRAVQRSNRRLTHLEDDDLIAGRIGRFAQI